MCDTSVNVIVREKERERDQLARCFFLSYLHVLCFSWLWAKMVWRNTCRHIVSLFIPYFIIFKRFCVIRRWIRGIITRFLVGNIHRNDLISRIYVAHYKAWTNERTDVPTKRSLAKRRILLLLINPCCLHSWRTTGVVHRESICRTFRLFMRDETMNVIAISWNSIVLKFLPTTEQCHHNQFVMCFFIIAKRRCLHLTWMQESDGASKWERDWEAERGERRNKK